ncbi:MAG: DUF4412 domain-containing protein [Anditalea sp.]
MKRKISLCLALLFIAIPFVSEAQLLNKIRRAAEKGVSNAVEKRVEKEVENAAQRQLEKAFADLYGPSVDDPSGNYDFSNMMKGINMNIQTEDSYDFTGVAEMEITGTDENGKPIDPILMKTFLHENSDYSAMEFAPAEKEDALEKTIMIFDMKNNASIILLENEGEKSSMAIGLDWQSISEGAYADSLEIDKQEFTFEKSGNTKNIAGHLCEEYIGETEEYKGSYWITKEPIDGISSFWGKNSPFLSKKMKTKNEGYFDKLPDGNILEINHQSKTDKTTMKMGMINIDEDQTHAFVMADYPNMMKGQESAQQE